MEEVVALYGFYASVGFTIRSYVKSVFCNNFFAATKKYAIFFKKILFFSENKILERKHRKIVLYCNYQRN